MLPKRQKRKGKTVEPVFSLKVPNFQAMNEKYKKKLEELGYTSEQSPGVSISMQPEVSLGNKEEKQPERQRLEKGRKNKDREKKKTQKQKKEEEKELIEEKRKADNPCILEMTMRNVIMPFSHAQKAGSGPEESKQLRPKDSEIIDNEFMLDMFLVLDKHECRILTRYDTWENDLSPDEWMQKCQASTEQSHGMSPIYNGENYIWQPVIVKRYDKLTKKYDVSVVGTGQEKQVSRLAIRFNEEDENNFNKRLNECKVRREFVENELRFQEYVDNVSSKLVTNMNEKMISGISKKALIQGLKEEEEIDSQHVKSTTERLAGVLGAIYRRTMKKCIVLNNMMRGCGLDKWEDLRIPAKLCKKTNPYLGVVEQIKAKEKNQKNDIEKLYAGPSKEMFRAKSLSKLEELRLIERHSAKRIKEIKAILERREIKKPSREEKMLSWQTGQSAVGLLNTDFQDTWEKFRKKSLFLTDFKKLELPLIPSEMMKIQLKTLSAMTSDILNNWRFQILHDIRKRIQKASDISKKDEIEKLSIKREDSKVIAKKDSIFDISDKEEYDKSPARLLIRRFDIAFKEHFGHFLINSVKNLVNLLKEFTCPKEGELWRIPRVPLIEIEINFVGSDEKKERKDKKKKKGREERYKKEEKPAEPKNIIFKPDIEECRRDILSLLDKVIDVSAKVIILETEDYNIFLSGVKEQAFKLTPSFPQLVEAKQKINAIIDENIIGPQQLLEKFKKYEYLMNYRLTDLDSLMHQKPQPTIDELRNKLEEFSKAEYEILSLANDKVPFTLFQIDTKAIKEYLAHRARKLKNTLLECIKRHCVRTIEEIHATFVELQAKVEDKPTSKEAYKELKICVDGSNKKIDELKQRHENIGLHIDILEDHFVKIGSDVYRRFYTIHPYPSVVRNKIQKGRGNLMSYEEQIRVELEKQKDQFDAELTRYRTDFEEVKQFNDVESAKSKYKSACELQKGIENAVIQGKKVNEIEELLEVSKKTEYVILDKLEKDFKPFYILIADSDNIQSSLDSWMNNAFVALKPPEIEEKISSWMTELEGLEKQLEDNKEQADVIIELKGMLNNFNQHIDLIRCLRSEAIKEDELNEINKVAPLQLKSNDETLSLNALLKKNAEQYLPDIKEIWERAEKKLELEKGLKKLKDEMSRKRLEIIEFGENHMHLIQGYDIIMESIEEQITLTQSMLSSPYMSGSLKKNCFQWQQKLQNLSDLLEELRKCQKTWVYLEPIFAQDDIKLQLKLEAEQFAEVNTKWTQQMEILSTENLIISLLEKEKLKEDFLRANEDLDGILRSLSDYLEAKRKKFPRFYFISDADLLRILSNAKKDPLTVEPFLNKCFEGLNSFEVKLPIQEIIAVSSAQKERIELIRPLGLKEKDRKGNVEIWLKDLEEIIKDTLKKLSTKTFKDYECTPRSKWILAWPAQLALAVNQAYWTFSVEEALKGQKPRVLENYEDKLNTQINEVVTLVRGELSYISRLTLEAFLVIDNHSKDIVHGLIENKINDVNSFEWISHLRYYKEKDDIKVKMITATLSYGFEYLCSSTRLVITPLTDRCYRTLMIAKQMNRGGILEGPAGAGKTETVKDLAKALGIYCVIFIGSEELDSKATAKFFKGIASVGAWCCFDEFNRIDLEVLSVIASQILMIQQALTIEQSVFHFTDEDVILNPLCGINVTMNPGQIGRTSLPDNLKTLFRPCVMTCPDYALIAEILLYSNGFYEARNLGRKIVTALRLCTEQLSSQEHYDFGMRALHAILASSRELRKKQINEKEENIIRNAIDVVSLPKLTGQDIPLYLGIATDLFPDAKVKEIVNETIKNELVKSCKSENLQPKEQFIKKCLQLYETMAIRHGVMIIGETLSGKSQAIKALKKTLTSLKENNGQKYANMMVRYLNPKSISFKQLYGFYNEETRNWDEGVLAILIREFTEMESPDAKWLVIDGPVDVSWMESMNTVLDDNKKLCLSSGSVIKLKPNLSLLFEVDDLKYASPAIVSRCGMVFMESKQLGWEALIKTYNETLPSALTPQRIKLIEEHMNSIIRPTIPFMNKHCKFAIEMKIMHLVKNFLNIFESFIFEYRSPTTKVSNDVDNFIPNFIFYSFLWSFGGALDKTYRDKFQQFSQDLILGKDINVKYKLELDSEYSSTKLVIKFREDSNLFEQGYDRKKNAWYNYSNNLQNVFASYTKDTKFHEIIVSTIETERLCNLLKLLAISRSHLLFVGPSGSGKTISIASELKNSFSNQQYSYMTLCMSAQTTAIQTQHFIESKLEKRGRKTQFGPSLAKKGIIFIDDLNMPEKDQFESQPPLELLRQWMDYGGWYDVDSVEKNFKRIEDVSFVGAMGPPSAGRQSITSRYLRHYNIAYIEPSDSKSVKTLFKSILDWSMGIATPNYMETIKQLSGKITEATVETYLSLTKEPDLRPTPSRSHYAFNLRDIGKVFQGICRVSSEAITKEEDLIKLWAHECLRVFHDRLICQKDRDIFLKILKNMMNTHFSKDWESVVTTEPLLFGSIIPHQQIEEGKEKMLKDPYKEIVDIQDLKASILTHLTKYNEGQNNKIDIVLFMDAIEHILKILRVISLPLGHCLLVGVGGSGRKSLTTLAANIGNYQLNIMRTYHNSNIKDWYLDLQSLIMKTGVEKIQTVFFLSDTLISNESFLEDINYLLSIGEVPNLFSKQDKNDTKEDLWQKIKEMMQLHSKKGTNNDEEIFEILKEHSKENLHIIFSMNSMGSQLRQRFRMFPSLVNQMTMDWFLPWPVEALRSVASQSISESMGLEKVKEGIINVCVDMQVRVRSLSEKYMKEMQCYYYVTPTSYLELLHTFKKLMEEKKKILQAGIKSYENGLEELKKTETFVIQMKAKLAEMEPELKKKVEGALHSADSMKKKQQEVAEETKIVQKEEENAGEAKLIADKLQAECQMELDKAMPELNDAEKAMGTITPAAISILAKMDSPPEELKPVAKALCIILDIKPKIVPKSDPDYWVPKKIFIYKNIKRLQEYDKENIAQAKIIELKKITDSPEFTTQKIIAANSEGEMIARWIRALVKFDQINREVAPKKIRLSEESAKAKLAQEVLTSKSKKLEETKALLANYKQMSDNAEAQKVQLTQEIEITKKKSERAHDLVDLLKNEKKRWNEQLNELQEKEKNCVGDILISSGIIAYLGVFPATYREACTESWRDLLSKFSIPKSETFTLFNTLCDPSQKLEWQKQKLPTDSISTDNAIIMERSNRWPLLIDPQRQAADWIRRKEMDKVETLKKTNDIEHIMNRIAYNITSGTPVILEDIGETIDLRLEPILKKKYYLEAGKTIIKIGENSVVVNKKFVFYMTTKLPRPHYSPEICSMVTMLNFTATEEGLLDQMLNIIVRKEDPNTEKNREEAIQKTVSIRTTLKIKEEEILKLVTNYKETILEGDTLIDNLRTTKNECQKFASQVEEQKKTSEKNDIARSKFQSVAKRVAALYFCIADLSKVGHMYQYSLDWYQEIYKSALHNDPGVQPVNKLENYKKKFTYLLFNNVCRSLFENDKLLFTLNMLLTIFVSEGINKSAEVKFFASGWCSTDLKIPQNPIGQAQSWLSDKIWRSIYEMSHCLPAFKDLDKEISSNAPAWEKISNSEDFVYPSKLPWPNGWSAPEKLNALQRLILINVLNPSKLIPAILVMICENLGKEFLEYPELNLDDAYAASSHKNPVLFILSPGADPMIELQAFAEKRRLVKGLVPMSLGKHQGIKAAELCITNILKGKDEGWIVMQNCHFAESYLPELEKKLNEFPEEPKLHFRLWLTSMPTDKFPVTLLQNSIKLTNEPPKGITRSLLNNYTKFSPDKFLESNPKPKIWKKMLFNMCLFHAIVQERSKYGSLGWNNIYEFTSSDLNISIDHLEGFLKNNNEIPWEALNYMVAEANYGGRISDPLDARCIKTVLSDFFSPEALKDNYAFCSKKEYSLPSDLKTKEDFIRYIKTLPMNDDTEIFGLNESANTTCALNEANNIIEKLLLMLPHISMGAAQTQEQEIEQTTKKLLGDIPNIFDIADCTKKYPYLAKESLNTVLLQEVVKYNSLLIVVKKSLSDVQNAIKGSIIMTPEIDEVAKSILKNSVPELWKRYSYPSLKPLASWVKDLGDRVKFFLEWIEKGVPVKFWISAFFSSQSFFTGILQNYARKKLIGFDDLIVEHEVIPNSIDLSKYKQEGRAIYGLYIEVAKWNQEKKCLEEADPKTIYTQMPLIWLKPIEKELSKPNPNVYECPVYKTTKRKGMPSPNGYSTNYMLSINLPMAKDQQAKYWIKRGVAMISQLND